MGALRWPVLGSPRGHPVLGSGRIAIDAKAEEPYKKVLPLFRPLPLDVFGLRRALLIRFITILDPCPTDPRVALECCQCKQRHCCQHWSSRVFQISARVSNYTSYPDSITIHCCI